MSIFLRNYFNGIKMNIYLEFLLNTLYIIFLLLVSSIKAFSKFMIPYKYRSKNVKDEIVLITGSGSGIGRLIAKNFAKLGAICVLVDIDENANQLTCDQILMEGGKAKIFNCDLSSRENIKKLAQEVYGLN